MSKITDENKKISSTNTTIEKYQSVKNLPKDWDDNIKDNIYLKREFLELIETFVSSNNSYYIFRDEKGNIDSQFLITESSDYNIAMFTPFNLPIKMYVIYFPFTLSRAGCVLGKETTKGVAKFLNDLKGYKLIPNIEECCSLDGFAKGLICPRCTLKIEWDSFEEYMSSLRSGYRRRYNIALNKSKHLKFHRLKNNKNEFTDEMYNLYLDVYNNAPYKLGKVTKDFFRQDNFVILVLDDESGTHGFAQLHENGNELIFEFVGLKKQNVTKYDTYIRLSLEIIRYGIENGFKIIDFGQTADDAKLKLGCKYERLYALINHSNPVINFLCQKAIRQLEYNLLDENKFRVFKENTN